MEEKELLTRKFIELLKIKRLERIVGWLRAEQIYTLRLNRDGEEIWKSKVRPSLKGTAPYKQYAELLRHARKSYIPLSLLS